MKEINFTTSLSVPESCFIPDNSITKQYKKGTYIYLPNEAATVVYIIRKGVVKITYPTPKNNNPDNCLTKSLLGKGTIFGEMVLVGEQVRKDYASAIEATELQVYTREDFQLLMQSRPYIQNLVLKQLGQKLLNMEDRFAAVIFQDARSRIIEFILTLAQQRGKRVGYDTMIDNFLTQKDIANYTATARQTVSTVLNGLRSKNLIYYNRKKLLIRDLSLLRQELSTAYETRSAATVIATN